MSVSREVYMRQVEVICDGIMANIAEYAVMVGCSYVMALYLAETDYLNMLCLIHKLERA